MSEKKSSHYEGLFLFPQSVSSNLKGAADHIENILNRADAEIVSLQKWDERRLAFQIKGVKRGVYFLAYFTADHDRLAGIERDCNLSEELLRSLILRADHVKLEDMQAADGRQQIADETALRAEDDAKSETADEPVEAGAS